MWSVRGNSSYCGFETESPVKKLLIRRFNGSSYFFALLMYHQYVPIFTGSKCKDMISLSYMSVNWISFSIERSQFYLCSPESTSSVLRPSKNNVRNLRKSRDPSPGTVRPVSRTDHRNHRIHRCDKIKCSNSQSINRLAD